MNPDWFIIPYIISLALLAFVRYNYNSYIKLVLFSTINYQASNIIYQENNKSKSSYILLFIFLISSGIFSFQLFKRFAPNYPLNHYWIIIPVVIFALVLFIIINKFLNYISGKIFLQEEISSEYNHNITVFHQSIGIILLPITILISYTKTPNSFIYMGIVFYTTIYLLKIIRLFKININKQLNFLYMFLYLCTLEIIPLLYIIKLFTYLEVPF